MPRDTVDDELRSAADTGCDHGEPRRHGFEDGVRNALCDGGQHENVKGAKDIGHVMTFAEEQDTVGQLQRCHQGFQVLATRPVACDDEEALRRPALERSECPDQGRLILDRVESADGADDESLRLDAEGVTRLQRIARSVAFGIDAVVDPQHLVTPDTDVRHQPAS